MKCLKKTIILLYPFYYTSVKDRESCSNRLKHFYRLLYDPSFLCSLSCQNVDLAVFFCLCFMLPFRYTYMVIFQNLLTTQVLGRVGATQTLVIRPLHFFWVCLPLLTCLKTSPAFSCRSAMMAIMCRNLSVDRRLKEQFFFVTITQFSISQFYDFFFDQFQKFQIEDKSK